MNHGVRPNHGVKPNRSLIARAWNASPTPLVERVGHVEAEPLLVGDEPLTLEDRMNIAQRRATAYERRAQGDEEGLDALIADTYRRMADRFARELAAEKLAKSETGDKVSAAESDIKGRNEARAAP